MKIGALKYDAYVFRILTSSWLTVLFIRMKCPNLTLLISVTLKSIFSDIRIETPACVFVLFSWCMFVSPFTLRQCKSLKLKRVS